MPGQSTELLSLLVLFVLLAVAEIIAAAVAVVVVVVVEPHVHPSHPLLQLQPLKVEEVFELGVL